MAVGAGLGPVQQALLALVVVKKMPVNDSLRRPGHTVVRQREIRSGWDKGLIERHRHYSQKKRNVLIRFMFPDPAVQRNDQAFLQPRAVMQCSTERRVQSIQAEFVHHVTNSQPSTIHNIADVLLGLW